MSDPTTPIQITHEMLAAARELFAGRILDCAHCGGWSKPDPRSSPVRYAAAICLGEERDTWYVRCFSCFASTSSTNTAAEALERWNRRTGVEAMMKTRAEVQSHLDALMESGECPSGDGAYLRALEWVLAGSAVQRQPEMLPLVDLQSLARLCCVELTPEQEVFARRVQADVLRLNRRPTC